MDIKEKLEKAFINRAITTEQYKYLFNLFTGQDLCKDLTDPLSHESVRKTISDLVLRRLPHGKLLESLG